MRRADLLVGLGLLVFAGLYFNQSFNIVRGFASDRLGPAFVPRLLALVLATLAIALVARAVRGRSDAAPLPRMRAGIFAATLALVVAYSFVLPRTGFLVATPLLLAGVVWLLGLRQWSTMAMTAVGVTAALYIVFGRMLKVLLP